MQVGVDYVDGARGQAGEGGGEQGGVEHELAPVGADAGAAAVKPGRDADDAQAGWIVAAGVRYNGNVIAMLLEGAGFFENADVTAVVREEAGRRDLEDMTTHDARLPYTRNLRRSGPTEARWILLEAWIEKGSTGKAGPGMTEGDRLVLATCGESETRELGRALGAACGGRLCVALRGALGAGKTVLVKGIAEGLGVTEYVTSPTFTFVNEYGAGGRRLTHVDLYRIASEDDLESIGCRTWCWRRTCWQWSGPSGPTGNCPRRGLMWNWRWDRAMSGG